jgi:RNA polymerase sigma-70 factor, ECF subfamily
MNSNQKHIEFMGMLKPIQHRLFSYARAITRDYDDAHDLVSETLLRAYENFETVKNKDSFASFLFTIARRIHKRKLWRKRLFGEYDEEQAENIGYADMTHETNYDIEVLYKALKEIPEKQSEAIILFEISGCSLEEIKKLQGGTLSGVKTRIRRGREKLKELITTDFDLSEYQKQVETQNGKADTKKIENQLMPEINNETI